MLGKKIVCKGRVQGVYYRASLQQKATELGLTGYVKNRSDGSVLAVVNGTQEAIAALVSWCWQGPKLSDVSHVEVADSELEEQFTQFEIRR